MELRIVLGQAMIARLLVLEDIFDDVKRMPHPRPHLRLELLIGLRQTFLAAFDYLPDRLEALGNMPAHFLPLGRQRLLHARALFRSNVACVQPDIFFLAMQQRRRQRLAKRWTVSHRRAQPDLALERHRQPLCNFAGVAGEPVRFRSIVAAVRQLDVLADGADFQARAGKQRMVERDRDFCAVAADAHRGGGLLNQLPQFFQSRFRRSGTGRKGLYFGSLVNHEGWERRQTRRRDDVLVGGLIAIVLLEVCRIEYRGHRVVQSRDRCRVVGEIPDGVRHDGWLGFLSGARARCAILVGRRRVVGEIPHRVRQDG